METSSPSEGPLPSPQRGPRSVLVKTPLPPVSTSQAARIFKMFLKASISDWVKGQSEQFHTVSEEAYGQGRLSTLAQLLWKKHERVQPGKTDMGPQPNVQESVHMSQGQRRPGTFHTKHSQRETTVCWLIPQRNSMKHESISMRDQ